MALSATLDLFAERKIIPIRKLRGAATALLTAPGDHFETAAVSALTLGFEGIKGDFHFGTTRRSGSREPWYPRGTEMRNERQLTLVSTAELEQIAVAMGVVEVRPEWIGANILLDGVADLSMLPASTLVFFEGGVTLKIDTQNVPCRLSGRQIAMRAGADDPLTVEMLFPKVARRLRGLTAWVEKPGTIQTGEACSIRVPEQWIY